MRTQRHSVHRVWWYNSGMRTWMSALLAGVALLPATVLAFPFGGQINQIIFCYNNAIYANVGPPRGGPFIWTPSTRTYQFGPPTRSGQYLLGLAAPPYYCVVSKSPVIVWSGILMTMEGSSGVAAPAYAPSSPPSSPATPPTPPPTGTTPAVPLVPTLGRVAISEVYYAVESARGSSPTNQWVELYNGTKNSVDVSGWTITNASSTALRTLPRGTTIASNAFIFISPSASTKSFWQIPSSTPTVTLGASIGTSLDTAGDAVVIKNTKGQVIDRVSWGTNTSAFNPPPGVVAIGHSLARFSLTNESHTSSDWIELPNPSPGR